MTMLFFIAEGLITLLEGLDASLYMLSDELTVQHHHLRFIYTIYLYIRMYLVSYCMHILMYYHSLCSQTTGSKNQPDSQV